MRPTKIEKKLQVKGLIRIILISKPMRRFEKSKASVNNLLIVRHHSLSITLDKVLELQTLRNISARRFTILQVFIKFKAALVLSENLW